MLLLANLSTFSQTKNILLLNSETLWLPDKKKLN